MNKTQDDPILVSKELTIENTTYCGSKCIMCPRDEYKFKWRHMDTGFFKDIIDQGVELGMQSLDACGFGDPFMDPKYEEKLRYVKEKYPFVKIYTSSTCHAMTKNKLGWVCSYVDTLKISNYGFSKEVYESIHRGTARYEKVIENIGALLAIPKSQRPYVIMLFLVFSENHTQIDDWKKYWEPKVEEVMIWLPHNWAGEHSYEHMDMPPSNKEKPKSCGRPFKGNLFIRSNGQVSMCCFDFNHQLVIGDLRKQSLKDVLAGPLLQKIRTVHSSGDFSQSQYICKNCDQIFSRQAALLYSTNPKRKPGVITSHPDLINDLYT
jgi:radical SAM protein with 4Fe4S-binding SPASM domain